MPKELLDEVENDGKSSAEDVPSQATLRSKDEDKIDSSSASSSSAPVMGAVALGGSARLTALLSTASSSSDFPQNNTSVSDSGAPSPVWALASQIYSQYAAPRPVGDIEPPRAHLLFEGWNEDTVRSGILGMSERQLLRRLCVGRTEMASDRVSRMYRAFQHVAAGGTPEMFSPSNPSSDKCASESPPRKIAALDTAGAKKVLLCLGRAEANTRDGVALQRYDAILNGPPPTPNGPGLPGDTVAASVEVKSELEKPIIDKNESEKGSEKEKDVSIDDGKVNDTVQSLQSDSKLPENGDKNVKNDSESTNNEQKPNEHKPLPISAPLAPLPGTGTVLEFFAVFGYACDLEPTGNQTIRGAASLLRMYAPGADAIAALYSALHYVSNALDNENQPSEWRVDSSTDIYRARLGRYQHSSDLMRAAGFDELPGDVTNNSMPIFVVDSAHNHLGVPVAETLPQIAKTKLIQARSELEAELEMIDGGNSPLVSRVLREVENSFISIDNVTRAANLARVLLGGRTLLRIVTNVLSSPRDSRFWRVNASSTVLVEKIRSLGESHAVRMMASIAFFRQADSFILRGTSTFDAASSVVPNFPGASSTSGAALPFFSFPSLPEETLSLLLRKRIELEETLSKIETRLDALGTPSATDLMKTPAIAAAPNPASAASGKTVDGKKKDAESLAAPVDDGGVLMSRANTISEASLVIPILVRAQLMTDPVLTAGPIAAGNKAGGAIGKDAKGKATANVGSALTVSATDPVYEIQLEQLRLLKQAYLRLDTRGTGCVTIADLKAAFAAEARPQKERTQEALQLWISSRDLNNDAAVSWPEFAASFAALFLAPGASPIIKSSGEPEKTAAVPAKPTSAAAAASNSSAGTHDEGLNLNAAKKDAELVANKLSDARRSLQAELTVLAATSVSQLQSVLRASLPPGVWKAEDGSAASLVSLPWAGPVLDVIAGIGLIQLFCDRNHARSLLSGWAAHVAAVVSEPSNSTLWVFKVTTPQEDDNIHADKSLATVHQREGDMTISWEVARLPGMHHLLRGFGFEAVQDPKNQRGGVPLEFRLGGSISSSWKKLPDTQRATMSACAQIMARHAIVFEASEAADPAAVIVAVASLICGSVASLLKKLASSNALTVTAASKATTDPKSSKAAAVSAKPDPKKSAVVAASGPIPSDPIFDDLVNADLADKWKVGLETMYEYVSKVAAAPTDMSARRINSSNIHFRQRLQYLPVPISAHSIEGEAVQVAPITWEGTKTLTAVGFRETTDGSLVLPPAASVALLQARALEVRAVLPLLRAAVALSSAKEAAARSLLPPTSAQSSTVSASAAVQDAPRVPTTLLSSVFDPRTASSRRFSDTSILRGGERLADFGESLNASGIAQSLNVSNTSVASATLLAANVSATAGQVQRPTTAPSQAISHSSALSTPAQVKGKPSPSPATVQPVSAAGDKNAKALVALGPSQAGDAVASILEESTRAAQESKTRISELEKEVANLQSQVRVQQVAELVPKLKQSLAPLAGAAMAEVRTTALAAAAGLGLKLAVAAEHSETKHSETKEGEKKLTKTEEKAPAGDKKKPSAAAAKSKKPALTATPIRVSSSAPEGGHEVTVQARISDMAPETLTAEDVARSAAGEQFVPVCLQLMAGDFVSISSESGSTQAFVRKVLSSSECDRPPDQYRLVLDRGLTHSMPEGAAYVSKKDATPEMTAAFFRNEVIEMLQKSFVVDLADSACDLAEAALRSRAAENRYAHRSVTRRIPCASLLFSDVSEAHVSVTGGTKKPYTFGVATRLVASCGGEAFLFNSMPALNLTLPPGTAPLSALSTPMSLGGSQADLFAHIFDLVDFGADGALEIQNFMTRSQREPSVWSVLCSNSIAPVFPLDSTGSTSTQPTPYQIWQRLHSAVPRITEAADQDPSNLNKSPPMLSRHVFTALFRPLHTLDFMVADKPSMRLLTYAHAGNVDLLDEASVEYWGRQWDTAKAAAPLLSESQLGDIVQVFARIHSQERLFADASWTAMTSNSVVQLDKRYPLPSELLTIRSTSDLFFALDGDSPSESELLSLANEAHSERLSDARKIRRRILNSGQEDDDDDNDEDEDDDALEFAPLVDAIGRRVPQDPWKGLSFASIVQMRVRRDSALKTASSSLSLNIAAERRRIFPTPGLGRIPHVLATLRSAFSDTRLVLIRSIVDSLKGKDTPTAIEERRRSVEDRVSSIPAADFIATISRTDAGRRSLSFPLALAGGSIAPNGAGSQFVTVQSVLEQLGKGCVSGHVTWAQVVGSIRSFGGSVSPPVDSSLKASYPGASQPPSIGLLFPSLADRPPARSSLIAAPSMQSPPASLIVLDVATNLLTNSIAVLTSDGALTSYDSSSLARKWMTSALSSRAALAIKWLRETRLPFLKLLSVSAENQSPGSVKSSTNSTVSGTASSGMLLLSAVPEAQGDIVVNSSAAAYAVGVANEMDKGISSLLLDATDPTGQSLIGLIWHSDAPSSGQVIGRITPRILADTELWTQGNASGGQHKVCVSGGTPFSLLEMVYLQDSHLIVGTCVPILAGGLPGSSEANLASSIIQDSETPHQIPGTASLTWPRLMAFDALTGACTADLGPLSSAVTSGSHLLYNPDTQQVIAADYLTLGKPESVKVGVSKTATITQTSPVIKVWDFSPVLAIAARQRAAFLQAAISPDRAAAASTSLLSHTLNQTANITGYVSPAVNVDELIPQVLALPHVIMLDVMSQFVQIDVKMPKKSSFEPGSSISSLCLLPFSGLLTVAQADGSLSLWDARYTRHRMQFPPTSNTTENDFSPSDQTFNAAASEADDARFTSLPKGCFPTSVLKLNSYFAGAGLLQFPQMPKFSSSSGFDGKLIRNLPPTEVSKFPVDRVKIGLAAVPGGLHSSISSMRHPCRLQVPICDTIRAFDIASGYDELHLKMFPGAGVKDPDREADAVLDALEGGGKDDEDSETIYAGYIYVLDDGSCIAVESPATAHLSSRALGKPLIGKIFDQRFVELTDDVYFCAAAASDISTDAYAALKRALLLRHRVARVFFIISKGVPLQSFLPALTRMVSIAPSGQRAGNSGQGTLSVPVAASPLSVITYYLAGTHDAASGGAGGAASSVTSIVEMCTPVSELKSQSQLPSSMPPFVCIPFFAAGDTSNSVLAVKGLDSDTPGSAVFEATNEARLVISKFFTTGIITALGTSASNVKIAEVALEYEDRVVRVKTDDVEVIETASRVRITSSPTDDLFSHSSPTPLVGDRVLVAVRPASVEAVLGTGGKGTLEEPRFIAERVSFPAAAILLPDAPSPSLDILMVSADTFSDATSSSSVIGGGTVQSKRLFMMWAVGVAKVDVPVPLFDVDLPRPSLRAIDEGFQRFASTILLRQQTAWAGARAVSLRREAVRASIITDRSIALYGAASSGRGTGSTAQALFRAASTVGVNEFDPAVPLLRSALGYVWGLVVLQQQSAEGFSGLSDQRVKVIYFLSALVAAAWHYPWFRFSLKPLLSLSLNSHQFRSGGEQYSGSLSLFAVASACVPIFKRNLLAETGRRSKDGEGDLKEESNVKVTFGNVLDAAAKTLRETLTIDSLLGVLEYLRDAGAGDGVTESEHMVQSLIRRQALSWDPQHMLSSGMADGATVDALTNASVVPTPLDQFLPAEAAFLLVNSPTVVSVTEPSLLVLAKAFADPVAAMKSTLQTMLSRSTGLHLLALQPEPVADTENRVLDGIDDDVQVLDDDALGPLARLGRAEIAAAEQLSGTAFTLLTAHGRLVSLMSAVLSDAVVPSYAHSMQQALAQAASKTLSSQKLKKRSRDGSKQLSARMQANVAAEARLERAQGEQSRLKAISQSLMERIHDLLERAAVSCSPMSGVDTVWLGRFLAACDEFASLVESAASSEYIPDESETPEEAEASRALEQSRVHSQLLFLLSQGAVEALVQCAILHTGYAIKLPCVPRKTSGSVVKAMVSVIERLTVGVLEENDYAAHDGVDSTRIAAKRLSPHLPRLLRALVYLATGRFDGISDDIAADTTTTAPVLHPIDSKMLQPAYVEIASQFTMPLIQKLFGVDGRGSMSIPSVKRYVSASGNASSLARGPAMTTQKDKALESKSETALADVGSPLVPLAKAPIVAGYASSFLPGLQRAAGADDMILKASKSSSASQRRIVSWSFEESVEQFAKRFMPSRGVAIAASSQDGSEDATHGATAAGILAMATTGSPHLISSFCTFRRCAAYWRQLPLCLAALAKLHQGVPDPLLDIGGGAGDVAIAGASGQTLGVAAHARLMERVSARRQAMSRFKLVLRPPIALAAMSPSLATEYQGGDAEDSVGSDDVVCSDIDRALLVNDLQIHDISVALMFDPDHEVRLSSFRTVRAVVLAVAGPALAARSAMTGNSAEAIDLTAELAAAGGGASSASSFASRARARRWHDILLRFSQSDCVVAASRRALVYIQGVTGPKPGNASNELYEIVSHAVDIFAAQAVMRTALPAAWRMCGVLGILARLAKMGLPRTVVEKNKSKKEPEKKKSGLSTMAATAVSADKGYADIVLRQICTDHGNEAMLTLARFDQAVHQWAENATANDTAAQELLQDTSGTWPSVCDSLRRGLAALRGAGLLETLAAAAQVTDPGARQAFLDSQLAASASTALGRLAAQAGSIRRALLLEMERVSRGRPSPPGQSLSLNEAVGVIWELTEAAWSSIMCTPPFHSSRGPIQAFVQSVISLSVVCARKGPVYFSLFLGCPPLGDPAAGAFPWRGLLILCRMIADTIHIRTHEADFGRFLQNRALLLLGDALNVALDRVSLPTEASDQSTDKLASQRAAVDRQYSFTLLAQAGDAGIVEAFASNISSHARLFNIAHATETAAANIHLFASQGQTLALGIRGRSLVWTAILRCALLRPFADSAIPPGAVSQLSMLIAHKICESNVFRVVFEDMLTSTLLIDSTGGLPPVMSPYGSTYPLRTEGASFIYCAGVLMLQRNSAETSSVDALHTNGIENAALDMTSAAVTVFQSTLQTNSRNFGSASTSSSSPLKILQDHVARIAASDGIVSSERTRLWNKRDIALGPTVPVVLHGLLMCVSKDEHLRSSLDEIGIPLEAIIWYRAAHRLFVVVAAAASDVSMSTSGHRKRYAKAEEDATAAWSLWRNSKLGSAPRSGETEVTRAISKGTPVAPPPLPAASSSARAALTGRFSSSSAGNSNEVSGVDTIAQQDATTVSRQLVTPARPPSVPTKMTGTDRSVLRPASATQQQSSSSASPGTNISNDLMSTASRRMKKRDSSDSGNATNETPTKAVSQREAVAATADVLAKLGEAVIDVKGAFDAAARPTGSKSEVKIQVNDNALGSALRSLGLDVTPDFIDRLVAEGFVDAGDSATATFSQFLRAVGRIMQLLKLDVLPVTADKLATEQAAASKAEVDVSISSITPSQSQSASVVHSQDWSSGNLFRADIAGRLTLPPVPVPKELLRSIFERFATTRNAAPGSSSNATVRGITFSAWTAALAGAGVPVAPSEARELFRFLHLPLGEIVQMPQLREAYLAIAGFRFLVMTGLMREGSDMHTVVMGGKNASRGDDDDDAVSDVSDDVHDEDSIEKLNFSSEGKEV
jgi:hypothetical protein